MNSNYVAEIHYILVAGYKQQVAEQHVAGQHVALM